MSMTTRNFGQQNREQRSAEADAAQAVGGLDTPVEIQTENKVIKTLQAADSTGSSFSTPNDYKNTQEG